ncbi:hypothetical protein [Roseibium algae]|uniref:Uncharacterized protein n=1 Tax=Roseibium algae TaxID=3123038 RepID=A0ABU8TPM8_9HYPH
MSSPSANPPFFIGYGRKVPASLRLFLGVFCLCFLIGLGASALLLPTGLADPGVAGFQWNQRSTQIGKLELRPYPVLRLPPDETNPAPRTVMLAGPGKRGVFPQAQPLEDMMVSMTGIPIRRGDLTMVQVSGGPKGLSAVHSGASDQTPSYQPSNTVPLGRWRLSGEICDGKCYSGAMRPGRGLAHKACANLCLSGGVPPVFVTEIPVEGRNFFLLTAPDGSQPSDEIYDLVGLPVTLEGDVEKLDDLLVFKASLAEGPSQ